MLVQNSVYRNTYLTDGVNKDFYFSFPILEASQVLVQTSLLTDTDTVTTVDPGQYTVTGVGQTTGGHISFTTAPPTGSRLALTLNIPITQLYQYAELDSFPAKSHEDALAKLTLICQQLKEQISRAVKVPVSSQEKPEDVVASIYAFRDNVQQWLNEVGTEVGDHSYVTPSGATTARTLADRFADVVNVKDFGAVGDGITDDTDAIQEAINYAESIGGGVVYIPSNMILKCSKCILGKPNVSIRCESSSWLDYTGTTWLTPNDSMALFGYYGIAGNPIMLETDATEGSNKVNVPDASVFTVGDMIELSMESTGKWDDTSVAVTAGQLAIVTGVYPSSNNIVLSEPLYETLTVVEKVKIRKITPIRDVIIDGLGIIGNGRNPEGNAEQGIKIFFGRDVTIKNCRLKNVDTQSIGVVSCYNANIFNSSIEDAPLGAIDVVSYGITYSSSMYVKIYNNQIINSRHGIVSSHLSRSYGYYGINRFIDIYSNAVTSNYGDLGGSGFIRAHAGIAVHTDTEYMSVHDNFVVGCRYGVNIRTANNRVYGNTITSCIYGVYLSEYFSDVVISDNSIFDTGNAIMTSDTVYNIPRGVIDISKNTIRDIGGLSIQLGDYDGTLTTISICNNDISRFNPYSDSSAVISVYGKGDFIAKGNRIAGGKSLVFRIANTYGCAYINCNTFISNNEATSQIYIVNNIPCVVTNNTFITDAENLSPMAVSTKIANPYSVISSNKIIKRV